MASSEYQREYRLNNPDKYLIWDKNSRERRKLKMQTDPEYRERVLASKRKSDKKRIEKIKSDPELLSEFRKRRNLSVRKWYNQQAKLKRVLNNMKTINIEKVLKQEPKPIKQESEPISTPKPKIKLSQNQIRESALQAMQNKISHLNCVITIPEIRDAKINELQQNFYQQYGAI